MSSASPIAFIIGASRGIGKAGAPALAEAGYDVVVTARTLQASQKHDYAAAIAGSGNQNALPGSVEETAATVEALGQRALPLRLDLLDHKSTDAALERSGETLHAPSFAKKNGLPPGWPPQKPTPQDESRRPS